jgi:predicted ATPase/DNA-binding CsgD family transcriptional regulator
LAAFPLIGRERDLERIRQALNEPSTRLVTLSGPGGVGKTRVAMAIAADEAERTGIAPPVIELASVSDSNLILSTIASTIEIEHSASGSLLQALARSLGDDPGLLVLDNLEHLPDAPLVVAELLHAVPGLRILATSRSRLHLTGEILIELAPLTVPAENDSRPGAPEHLARFSAVELFVQRMREQVAWFELNDENSGIVADICRRIEGLPLAIELVTSRARALSLQDMRARLEQPLTLMNAPRPDAPARQWTMQASIEWSVNLLAPAAQDALARLAVFPGSFDLAAAETVAGAGAREIEALLDQHLIRLVDRTESSHRFMFLETIKQFGLERLQAAGEEAAQRDRHAAYATAQAEALEPRALSAEWERARRDFDRNLDDFYAALAWSIERGDADTGARIFAALRPFWLSRVPWETGYLWLQRLRSSIDCSQVAPKLAARCLVAAGLIAYHAGQVAESAEAHEQAAAIAREAGDQTTLALALSRLGQTLRGLGDMERSAGVVDELKAVLPAVSDHSVRFHALNEVGAQAMVRQDVDAAWDALQQGLVSARALSFPGAEGVTLHFLGYVAALRGDYAIARDVLSRACTLQTAGSESERLSTLHALGRVELLAGQPAEAARWIGEALAGRNRRGDRLQVRICLIDMGLVAIQAGRPETAARWFGTADIDERVSEPSRFFARNWIEGVEATRAALGAASYNQSFQHGQVLSLETAVDEALAFANDLAASPEAVAPRAGNDPPYQLTARELDVLRLLSDGASDRKIAEVLYISPGTATRHVKNILRKLGVPSRTAAATFAVRRGIIPPSP